MKLGLGGERMKTFFIGMVLVLSFAVSALAFPLTPNPDVASGTLCTRKDKDYFEDRYKEKIPYCIRNVSVSVKNQIFELYKVPKKSQNQYTIDHIIPLALGGDNSFENLWPEHKKVKATRQNLEIELYWALRNNQIKQREAIKIILEEKFKH